MAYEKTFWKDRIVERPNTYRKTDNPDGTITLYPTTGQVIEKGTPVSAANLNKIENGIVDVYKHLNDIANKGTTVEVVERFTKKEIDRQIADGTIANLTIAPGSITKDKLDPNIKFGVEDGEVTSEKLGEDIAKTIKGNNLFTGIQMLEIEGVQTECSNFIDLSKLTKTSIITNIESFVFFAYFTSKGKYISKANTSNNGIINITPGSTGLLAIIKNVSKIKYIINSDKRTDYIADRKVIKQDILEELEGNKIKDRSISINKLDDSFTEIEKGTNLYKYDEALKNYSIKDSKGATIITGNFSNFIEVTEGVKYASSKNYTQFYFLDANKLYINSTTIISKPAVFTPPEGAKYVLIKCDADKNIKVCEGTSTENVTNDRVIINTKLLPSTEGYKSRWKGKKWIVIGDSISTEKGPYAKTGYPTIVANDLGFASMTNLAVSGRTMTDGIGWVDTQVPNQYDLITVMMGTNDMGYNTAIGTINDVPSKDGTFYARCKMMVEKLLNKNLGATIAFFTPIRRANGEGFTDFNVNALGKTTEDYANVVKDVCNHYGIECLDLYNNGINPRLQEMRNKYFVSGTDGTHPNDLGHAKYIAPKVRDFLEKIAPYDLT